MNRSIELYNNLMNLINDEDSPFYLIEHVGPYDGATYHVFSYRLGSYTDFLRPDALECRGHMFRIDGNEPVLVSLPFPKFFNRGEVEGHINSVESLLERAENAFKNGELSEHLYRQLEKRYKK